MTRQEFANAYNEIEIRAYQIADYLRQHGTTTLVTQIGKEKEKRGSLYQIVEGAISPYGFIYF